MEALIQSNFTVLYLSNTAAFVPGVICVISFPPSYLHLTIPCMWLNASNVEHRLQAVWLIAPSAGSPESPGRVGSKVQY